MLARRTAGRSGSVRRGAGPPRRTLDCTAPGRSTTCRAPVPLLAHRGRDDGGPLAVPAGEGAGGGVDGRLGVEVADEHQRAPGRDQPLPVQLAQRGRADQRHLLGGRQLQRVGVGAVAPLGQRDAGDDAGLRAGDRDPLGDPRALGLDLGVRVGGRGEHLGEDAEDRRAAPRRAGWWRTAPGRGRWTPPARRRGPAPAGRSPSGRAARCPAARRRTAPRRGRRAARPPGPSRRRRAPAGAARPAGRRAGARRPRAGRWAGCCSVTASSGCGRGSPSGGTRSRSSTGALIVVLPWP